MSSKCWHSQTRTSTSQKVTHLYSQPVFSAIALVLLFFFFFFFFFFCLFAISWASSVALAIFQVSSSHRRLVLLYIGIECFHPCGKSYCTVLIIDYGSWKSAIHVCVLGFLCACWFFMLFVCWIWSHVILRVCSGVCVCMCMVHELCGWLHVLFAGF